MWTTRGPALVIYYNNNILLLFIIIDLRSAHKADDRRDYDDSAKHVKRIGTISKQSKRRA